jgi:uncharacterized protein
MPYITVEVAYALPKQQKLIQVFVEKGSTMMEAVQQSGILNEFPDIDLAENKLGIFGKAIKKAASYQLKPGDRIEIYRPLPTPV